VTRHYTDHFAEGTEIARRPKNAVLIPVLLSQARVTRFKTLISGKSCVIRLGMPRRLVGPNPLDAHLEHFQIPAQRYLDLPRLPRGSECSAHLRSVSSAIR
jgi:hypothetical protein